MCRRVIMRVASVADLAVQLCDSVANDKAIAIPAVATAHKTVRSSLAAPLPELCRALSAMAIALLSGVPFRLTRTAMQTLLLACIRWLSSAAASASATEHHSILIAAAPLWAGGLSHANRDVRVATLQLLHRLHGGAAAAELQPTLLEQTILLATDTAAGDDHSSNTLLHLAALLHSPASSTSVQLAAVLTLRGILLRFRVA